MNKINMSINELTTAIHNNSLAHGWYDGPRSFAELIALCHSELSEALEEYRAGREFQETYYPDGQEPNYPICPICHEETDTFYVDPDEQIIGCDNCIKIRDAWEMIEDDDYWRGME